MDVTSAASITIQANTLDAVRSTLSATRSAPGTPQAQQDVILQLSTAAQQLLQQPKLPDPPAEVSDS